MHTRSVLNCLFYLVFFLSAAGLSACTAVPMQGPIVPPERQADVGSSELVPEQPGADTAPVSQGNLPDSPPSLLPTSTPYAIPPSTEASSSVEASSEPASDPGEGSPTGGESVRFAIGNELTIDALRARTFEGSDIVIEQTLPAGANYAQYIASYTSDGNKIYGLLTVPSGDVPEGGFPAIVFNHGYIPPADYRTTERYVAYVDALARNGFVVFKIDLRGFGNSEGEATGAYFSPGYTIDAINALKSLQRLDYVDPDGIGMWGHSMAGNLVLRANVG